MSGEMQTYENSRSFFQNRSCEAFPCHEGVDPRAFNCLFCYCPLYALGPRCGGTYRYNRKGVKDCTGCTLLHDGDGGAAIVKERFKMLAELARLPEDGADGEQGTEGGSGSGTQNQGGN